MSQEAHSADLAVQLFIDKREVMGRKSLSDKKKLKHLVTTRVTEAKYRELKHIIELPPHYPMSDLIGRILGNQSNTIFTSDATIEPVLEELRTIREKIKLTGILINQHTKGFNSHTTRSEKESYAKLAFTQDVSLKSYIYRLLEIVKETSKRWLTKEFSQDDSTGG